ncbi:F-box/LRR-repeat protein 25-like protein [Tanacetum coccineum]|uniref:F-box/LRR-repeat protein 25-like protein n=1 Tax=Tanacetum coccineum TaxID=301880 RepID=A0ABQ5ARN7_9ASTR
MINTWGAQRELTCNVQDLDIYLGDYSYIAKAVDQIVFDKSFFINPSFTHLKLECCFASPTGFFISWENLKSLCLSYVDLNEDLFQSILFESPGLETFKLNECLGFTRLDIISKSVKKFVISGYKSISKDKFVHLNAPSILSLTIQGCMILRDLRFVDVFSLVKAKFYHMPGDIPINDDEEYYMLKEHLEKLCHVKHELKLKLGDRCSEVLYWLEAQRFIVPPNIKHVVDNELE